ncbi:MAG: pyridoxamine 5'-phosphate oxidase family protein [Xanthobacteraceae bacterium]
MSRKDSTSIDRVWDIIEKVGIAMLTTSFPGGLRARPVEARPERDAGLIWFVTDRRSGKEHEIEAEHDVGLVFIDARDKAYLSITARAEVRHDHAKVAEIWKSTDDMWWNGPDDPNVCVLRVRPLTAELWDGPASAAVAAFEFVKARITGKKPNLGENRKVTVKMVRAAAPRKYKVVPRKRPSATYRILWRAIRARKRVSFSYGDRPREVCPHILGYNATGHEAVFVFQIGGQSSRPLPLKGDWRCFELDGITDIQLRDGEWRGGTRHSKPQSCVQFVDVDVNISETLTRGQPLPFGSPALRPPRKSGE